MKLNFEQAMDVLQSQLETNFGFSDDEVIDSLRSCMEELRRSKVALPAPSNIQAELMKEPFGEILKTPISVLKQRRERSMSRNETTQAPKSPEKNAISGQITDFCNLGGGGGGRE